MAALKIFVSHSHHDSEFCRFLVYHLRHAGADVWYDEQHLGTARLMETIEQELRNRSVFLVVLSPKALISQWVRDETLWAYTLLKKEPHRVILPIIASDILPDTLWLFLAADFPRVEKENGHALSRDESIQKTLALLALPHQFQKDFIFSITDLLVQAKALREQNEQEKALALVQSAIVLAPDNASVWYVHGEILVGTGSFQEAITAFQKALVITPENGILWNYLGHCLNQGNRYEESLECFERSLNLLPGEGIVWQNKGVVLNNLGRFEEALPCLNRAMELLPDSDKESICIELAATYVGLQQYEVALSWFDQALKGEPDNSQYWMEKAVLLEHHMKRPLEAILYCDRAIELSQQNWNAWLIKVDALRQLNRHKEADELYQKLEALQVSLVQTIVYGDGSEEQKVLHFNGVEYVE